MDGEEYAAELAALEGVDLGGGALFDGEGGGAAGVEGDPLDEDDQGVDEVDLTGVPFEVPIPRLLRQFNDATGNEEVTGRIVVQLNDFIITDEDRSIYLALPGLAVVNARTAGDALNIASADSPIVRLYATIEYVLQNDTDNIPSGNLDFDAALDAAAVPEVWSRLYTANVENEAGIRRLFTVKTKFSIDTGNALEDGHEEPLFGAIRRKLPLYAFVWIAQRAVVSRNANYVQKEGDQTFVIGRRTDIFTALREDAPVTTAGAGQLALLIAQNSPLQYRMMTYVLMRLLKRVEEHGSTTLLSRNAQTLLELYRRVLPTADDVSEQTNNFEDRRGMISLMLGCAITGTLSTCMARVKATLAQGPDEDPSRLIQMVNMLFGFDVVGAIRNPLAAEFAPFVRATIRVSDLASLACVWLASNQRLPYHALLQVGNRATEDFFKFSSTSPFIQAVLLSAAAREGPDALASINSDLVATTFQTFAMAQLSIAPSPGDVDQSSVLGQAEETIVSALFYGVLTPSSAFTFRPETYLKDLDPPVRRAPAENAPEDPFEGQGGQIML
uniref:Uncharacterized protein n=1 Tax=viral metagenome TaxID=1070528 RepID=A0A2V0RB76_9ZZZZ